MRRFGVVLLLAAVAAGGCAAPAKYIEKRADSGVVAVPDDSDSWPTYNRRAALDKIQQHVGPNYEILDERRVVTGQTTQASQQTQNDYTLNKRNPAQPGERQTTTGTATQQDVTQWQITYRRKPAAGAGEVTTAGAVRTQYPAADVRPAGGPISAFNRPAPPATGGADCNH